MLDGGSDYTSEHLGGHPPRQEKERIGWENPGVAVTKIGRGGCWQVDQLGRMLKLEGRVTC